MRNTKFKIFTRQEPVYIDLKRANPPETEENFEERVNAFLQKHDVLKVDTYWSTWQVFVWYNEGK